MPETSDPRTRERPRLMLWSGLILIVTLSMGACTSSSADYDNAREAADAFQMIEGVGCEVVSAQNAFSFEGPGGERITETPTGKPVPTNLVGQVAFCIPFGGQEGLQVFWVGFFGSPEAASDSLGVVCDERVVFHDEGNDWIIVIEGGGPLDMPISPILVSDIEDVTKIEGNAACR